MHTLILNLYEVPNRSSQKNPQHVQTARITMETVPREGECVKLSKDFTGSVRTKYYVVTKLLWTPTGDGRDAVLTLVEKEYTV